MIYPFRFTIGDRVRPTAEFLASEEATKRNIDANDVGQVASLTLDGRGTYVSVKIADTRILARETSFMVAG